MNTIRNKSDRNRHLNPVDNENSSAHLLRHHIENPVAKEHGEDIIKVTLGTRKVILMS
jgi:hypothetical protein